MNGAAPGWAARIEASWTDGGALAQALRPLGALNAAVVGLRRALYRRGLLSTVRLDVPVVVVGNRVVGGAGKTPVTLALAQALQAAGWRPGIVSRGHGARESTPRPATPTSTAADIGDEPLLLARRAGVPLWVGRDRAAAAQALRRAHPDVDVILCDDGLQHLRLGRDLEVIVFDERGAGNGRLLPAGPLREPVDAPTSASLGARGVHVLYNAAQPSTRLPGACARRALAGLVPLARWWQGEAADAHAWQALAGTPVIASAGLGQPQRFFDALQERGLTLRRWPLPDHHDYATLPWPDEPAAVIVTEKDAVKLAPARLARERPSLQVWVAPLQLELPPAWLQDFIKTLESCRRTAG